MDLLTIAQSLWRHKLLAIPVIVLTVIGGFYILKLKAPVYEASSSVLLIDPQGPTATQAASPALRKINSNNPYVDYGDLDVVADSVIETMTSPDNQAALANAGVDSRYSVELSTDYGNPPIIAITGVGASAQQAIHGADVLAQTATTDLTQMQKRAGVNNIYMIKSIELSLPSQAQLSSSGKLRSLIAVLGVGAILLFLVISVADVVEKRRMNAPLGPGARPEDRSITRARSKVSDDDWEAVASPGRHGNDASRQHGGNDGRRGAALIQRSENHKG